MVARTIVALEPESEASFVARLDCGHRRHVRHRPPLESYPWLLDPAQRAARIGQRIECDRCDRRERPEGLIRGRSSDEFTAATLPAGLLRRPTLAAGTWGEIVVLQGRLRVRTFEPDARAWILEAGDVVSVPPEVPHAIEALGEVRLRVDFYCAP